jgi:hypothetical protein
MERRGRLYNWDRQFIKETAETLDCGLMLSDDDLRRLRRLHEKLKAQRNPFFHR